MGYLNRSFPGVKKGDKGGGEEERTGGSEQVPEGKEGGNEGKRVGGKGPEITLKRLGFWYPSDLGTFWWPSNQGHGFQWLTKGRIERIFWIELLESYKLMPSRASGH